VPLWFFVAATPGNATEAAPVEQPCRAEFLVDLAKDRAGLSSPEMRQNSGSQTKVTVSAGRSSFLRAANSGSSKFNECWSQSPARYRHLPADVSSISQRVVAGEGNDRSVRRLRRGTVCGSRLLMRIQNIPESRPWRMGIGHAPTGKACPPRPA